MDEEYISDHSPLGARPSEAVTSLVEPLGRVSSLLRHTFLVKPLRAWASSQGLSFRLSYGKSGNDKLVFSRLGWSSRITIIADDAQQCPFPGKAKRLKVCIEGIGVEAQRLDCFTYADRHHPYGWDWFDIPMPFDPHYYRMMKHDLPQRIIRKLEEIIQTLEQEQIAL